MYRSTWKNRCKAILYPLIALCFAFAAFACRIQNAPPAEEALSVLTDAYFRAFFEKNEGYTAECVPLPEIMDANAIFTNYVIAGEYIEHAAPDE